jgi:hypothetical protein
MHPPSWKSDRFLKTWKRRSEASAELRPSGRDPEDLSEKKKQKGGIRKWQTLSRKQM